MKNIAFILLLFWLGSIFCQAQANQVILQLEDDESVYQLKASNNIKSYKQLSKTSG